VINQDIFIDDIFSGELLLKNFLQHMKWGYIPFEMVSIASVECDGSASD
jgi:hypothetical protein